jgi:hypothetical protein
MKVMTITFTGIDQTTQQVGGDEHLSAIVHCTIAADAGKPEIATVGVKQTVGERLKAPLEIGPLSYRKPINRAAFDPEVEKYYRSRIHAQGDAISESPHVSLIMEGNISRPPPVIVTIPMPASDGSGGW